MLRPIGSQVRIDEMDRAESGVESTLEISLSTLTSGAGLTSGHAKGFVGVVEILPARDPAARMYTRAATTRRIASVMRRAAPIGSSGQHRPARWRSPQMRFGVVIAVSRSALGSCEEGLRLRSA